MLLDIGAVWCHWCHVIDRESYENPAIAKIISDNFIAVKVDRDERPDVDSRYQSAISSISGQGGWPLTGFLLPDGRPFFGGTYFPPDDQMGRPGFRRVLLAVAESYRSKRAELERAASSLAEAVAQAEVFTGARAAFDPAVVEDTNRVHHAAVRHQERRLRQRAEISSRFGNGSGSGTLPTNRRKAFAGDGRKHAGKDGARRRLRSARWGLSSLLGGRTVAGAAF